MQLLRTIVHDLRNMSVPAKNESGLTDWTDVTQHISGPNVIGCG